MQTSGNMSWIFSQLSQTLSSAATKTMSLELINSKKYMTHEQFIMNLEIMSDEIPFLKTILTHNELFTLIHLHNFIISQSKFQTNQNDKQKIGAGGNASVFLAIDYLKDYRIAMKIMDDVDEHRQESYLQECINQYKLQSINPNLILNIENLVFIKFQNNKATFQLPLELAEFSLFDYIQGNTISEENYQYFFNLFIDILILLHENKYAHRDIKPQNILFVKNKGCKLADFGDTLQYEEKKGVYKIQGTIPFMPKMLDEKFIKIKKLFKIYFTMMFMQQFVHQY